MRQAGVIAAAGIVALDNMVDRLKYDHDKARFLAEGIREIDSPYNSSYWSTKNKRNPSSPYF